MFLLLTALLLAPTPTHAMLLCEANLQHVDFAANLERNPGAQWTSKAVLNRNIQRVREICQERHGANCENFGPFGPHSMMWEVSRVPFLILGAGTELYLQLAHPVGAQGVYDHSRRLLEAPIARFQSTFNHLWNMTYGKFSDAERIARIVHLHHSKTVGILEDGAGRYKKGEVYSATDPHALLWVHATHMYALLNLYETLERPLTAEEKDRFFADSKLFAMLLGIPEEMAPGTTAEFESYFSRMLNSDEIGYTPLALRMERHFRAMGDEAAAKSPAARLLWRYADLLTAATLPRRFAGAVGIADTSISQDLTYITSMAAFRAAYRRMPALLRELPLYRMAMARAQGRTESTIDRNLFKAMVGFTYSQLGEKRR